jgi:tetratricopeptide (TPR) repeat protein
VQRPQWITIFAGVFLVIIIYSFGRIVPRKTTLRSPVATTQNLLPALSTDSILSLAKNELAPETRNELRTLESNQPVTSSKAERLKYFHDLAHFWSEKGGIFEPYAWYEAEAARLENSQKSLNFAARLFLENLQQDSDPERVRWKALQAKDLFERSLKIDPVNDSARVGIGACYLFGNISPAPMEGIAMIRQVAEKDSTNIYAQMMLAKGSVLSGQYDKAISRLLTVNQISPGNAEAILMLADLNERMNKKQEAINWYNKSLQIITREDIRSEILKRIAQLGN